MNKKIKRFIKIHSKDPVDYENLIDKIKLVGDKIKPLITEKNLQKILDVIEKDLVFIDEDHDAFNKHLCQSTIPLINLSVQFCFLFSNEDIFANTPFDYRIW